ncbi:MAG: N-acetyltransferase [Clostridiales bacterium]|nr:N-acetyltransferase [Candidatus Blautia equi]
METASIQIRTASVADAEQILNIYIPYILDTAITFEYVIPTLESFKARIRHTLERYPYYVAVEGDRILGYAYASEFKGRKAYDWSVETSIYVDRECHGRGIGRLLYDRLEEALGKMGITNVNACIAYTENEEEHLTNDSMYFHEHLGYALVGTFHKCAWKFDKWYDMIWMEKMIGEHVDRPADIRSFKEIEDECSSGRLQREER